MSTFFKKNLILGLFFTATHWLSAQNCQTIQAQIQSNPAANDSGIVQICVNTTINFTGKGVYPQNDTRYHQSDSTASMTWGIGYEKFQGKSVNYRFTEGGIFRVILTIRDTIGCIGTMTRFIRVSAEPIFRIKAPIELSLGDSVVLKSAINRTDSVYHVTATEQFNINGTSVAQNTDKFFIPDNPSQIYQSPIIISNYDSARTLQSINEFFVQINMEHSYARDLEISLTCPNGRSTVLHKFDFPTRSGNRITLGKPLFGVNDATIPTSSINDPLLNPAGEGLPYTWVENAAKTIRNSFPANIPGSYNTPAGNYKPDNSLTSLIGCPLNGEWKLTFRDNFQQDNGWVFNWKLGLPPIVQDSFKTKIVSYKWLNEAGVKQNFGDSILIKPTSRRDTLYRFETKDNFGCTFRTAYKVDVFPKDYGFLTGQVYLTYSDSCKKDFAAVNLTQKVVKITNSMDTVYATTNSLGKYDIVLGAGNYKVVTDSILDLKFCGDSVANVNIAKRQTTTVPFSFKPRQVKKNLGIKLESLAIRRGFNADFYVFVTNKGTFPDTGSFTLSLDTMLRPLSYVGTWDSVSRKLKSPDFIVLPNQSLTFQISTNVSRFVPLSTPVLCTAEVTKRNTETDTLDNISILRSIITGAYDPNDKTVSPKGNAPYGTKTFDYTIRFQNTGNDTAFKVVVVDTLPNELDPLSISTLGTSHPYEFRMEGKGIATWLFNPIALVDSLRNEPESHGLIRFTIQSKGILPVGTRFKNRAGIYFDYNDVVMTNDEQTTIVKRIVKLDTIKISLCAGDAYKNVAYKSSTFIIDTLKGVTVDSLRPVNILVKPVFNTTIDTILKTRRVYEGITYNKDTVLVKKLKAINGCDSTVTIRIMVLPNALNDLPTYFSDFRIFPNPTQANLSIEFELKEALSIELSIVNLLGQRVKTLQPQMRYGEGKHALNFDVRDVNAGSFMLDVKTNTQHYRKLFIKQN
jgi:uncharacterized repeat protein (TIGR01451 family)